MQQERGPEKFQPRMVASFDSRQLIKIFAWGRKNNVTGLDALDRALESVRIDEEGNIMDEKSRMRIRYGVAVLSGLVAKKQKLNEIMGRVQVWQETPDEDALTVQVSIRNKGIQN